MTDQRDTLDVSNVEHFPHVARGMDPQFSPPHFQPPPVAPQADPKLEYGYVRTINVAMSVLSLRVLALIALLGAVGMFSYAVIDPVPWRLYAAGAYAAVVLWPVVWLYLKREI